MKITAVILAAGNGSRMKSATPKQFMELEGIPVFMHSVRMFDRYADKIVLVTSAVNTEYCSGWIDSAELHAESSVVSGGSERWFSSIEGVRAAGDCDIIMIHDAARACVDENTIEEAIKMAAERGSAIASVKMKDTVKFAAADGLVTSTPDRDTLRIVQTPQAFRKNVIFEAYNKLLEYMKNNNAEDDLKITDDAMVVESFTDYPVYLSEGSYENIKITTPEDLIVAGRILSERHGKAEADWYC